jgi:hypothetical protein
MSLRSSALWPQPVDSFHGLDTVVVNAYATLALFHQREAEKEFGDA